MRALVQRVKNAQVAVAGQVIGRIGKGLSVFLGVGKGDGRGEVLTMAEKVRHLRIFENESGRFDRSLVEVGGEALVVSQFTLYGDCRKGRRPSFTDAASPDEASRLYDLFVRDLAEKGVRVATGRFGERMEVTLVNDGPVTLWLEVLSSEGSSPSRT